MPTYDCIFHNKVVIDRYTSLRGIPSCTIRNFLDGHLLALVDSASSPLILEAGAGNGRFFLPLANVVSTRVNRGKLCACDVSGEILAVLQSELGESADSVKMLEYDLTDDYVPFECEYDLVFTVAVLHIIHEWEQALSNICCMLKVGGSYVMVKEINQFMHRTEGFDKTGDLEEVDEQLDQFFREYHGLRGEFGEPYAATGITYSDVGCAIGYLKGNGMSLTKESLADPGLKWQKKHTYGEILESFLLRTITTWGSDLSVGARLAIHARLSEWVEARGIDKDEVFYLPAMLQVFTFKKERSC